MPHGRSAAHLALTASQPKNIKSLSVPTAGQEEGGPLDFQAVVGGWLNTTLQEWSHDITGETENLLF